jgi:predicted metal-dependent hydrolase
VKQSQIPLPTSKSSANTGQTEIQVSGQDEYKYTQDGFTIHVTRSARRLRTVSARMVNWREIDVRAPALIPEKELKTIINGVVQRVIQKQARQHRQANDDTLQKRAKELNRSLFDGKLRWQAIGYVGNQQRRYGSCTPSKGTIRISDRLKQVPDWVLDYVIVHEMAHLLERGHNKNFWQLVYRYAKAERARGYLMALQFEEDNNAGEIQEE